MSEARRGAPAPLRELAQRCDACFGVYADVLAPGTVRLGDAVDWIG